MASTVAGRVYVLKLTGYRPRTSGPPALVKIGCTSAVERRVAALSTAEGLAEHIPEATLHPLLYSHDELVVVSEERYLPAELVFESECMENKFSVEKAVHAELDRLGLRVVPRRELFFFDDLAEALVRRVCAVGRELSDAERDDVLRQVEDPVRVFLCEGCGGTLDYPQFSLLCTDCCIGEVA